MKNLAIVLVIFALSATFVSAYRIDIAFPNGNEFDAAQPVTFKTTLYDDSGAPIDGAIDITIQDSEKRITQTTVQSKEVASVTLRETASSGQGIITAQAQGERAIAFFEVGREELAQFELDGDRLIVKNIGNTPYTRTISITIGDTTGTQTPNIDIGEEASYRLIAPQGAYNIRVTDGKTSLIRGGIQLTGTGNVIGAIDNAASQASGITGGVSPEEGDIALLSYLKQNKFVYVFVAVIFGAMILIAIERNYKRRVGK